MKVAISGVSGFLGKHLQEAVCRQGHAVIPITRDFFSYPDPKCLQGADAMVHLVGENIASQRWTSERKNVLRKSRIETTRRLCETIAKASMPPRVLICASAVGVYGDRGDEILDEGSAIGRGFLADLVRDWEAATAPARDAGIRVVNTRFGVVLSNKGGALTQMLPFFRWGLGAILGRQWMSWVALEDVISAILYSIDRHQMSGPMNVCAPNPVTNREFAKTLGRLLKRPVWPMPASLLQLALGEMAREVLLSSQRVLPNKLTESGFRFQYATLETTLRAAVASRRP